MSSRRDPHTKDLFSWAPEQVSLGYADEVTAGGGALDHRLARIVAQALKEAREAGSSRKKVAHEMTTYLKRPVSDDNLNKWSSEADTDRRIPLDAFIALIHVTGRVQALGTIARMFDMAVVPAAYTDLIELHHLKEHQREVDARAAMLEAKIRRRT